MPLSTTIKNKEQAKAHYDLILEKLEQGKEVNLEWKLDTRTQLQNNSLHRYLSEVARTLNNKGITFEMFFKDGYKVDWTKEIVKNECWRPIQKALTGKESTKDPKTVEYIEIYDYLNKKLAEHGIHVPWPNKRG